MSELISALIGIVMGVLLEDPLNKLKDNIIHFFKKLFYKSKKIKTSSGLFSLGKIKTDWLIVDGSGESTYTPKTLFTYFNNSPFDLPDDLKKIKKGVESNEKKKKDKGLPFSFNGDRYALERINVGRGDSEDLELQLWFRPSDYYNFLATNTKLDDSELYKKYIGSTNWEQPVKYFSNSFGINLCVITEDEYLILTKRSEHVGTYANLYSVSLSEGLSRTFDRGINTQAPDIYRAAVRGVVEELGINSVEGSDIKLLSIGVDTKYSEWGMLGMTRIDKKINEILDLRSRGVKDKWEASELLYVKFEVQDVIKFIAEHPTFAPAPLACIYQTLVHEYKREKVDKAVNKFLG